MANGSSSSPRLAPAQHRPRTSGVFSGLLLIVFGALLLLHNYGHLSLSHAFGHWWPLIFIFWGATKLYERTLAERQGRASGWITPGEVFLVLGLMTVVGIVIAVEQIPEELKGTDWGGGDTHSVDFDNAPQTVPVNSHVAIRFGR